MSDESPWGEGWVTISARQTCEEAADAIERGEHLK